MRWDDLQSRARIPRAGGVRPGQAAEPDVDVRAGPPASRYRHHRGRRGPGERVDAHGGGDDAGDGPRAAAAGVADAPPPAARPTPAAAARSSVVAATSRELVSGAWVDPRGAAARSSKASHDGEAALRAWETTAELLNIPLEQFAAARARPQGRAAQKAASRSRIPRSGWAACGVPGRFRRRRKGDGGVRGWAARRPWWGRRPPATVRGG